MRAMFLKCRQRRKDGKTHRSWSIVASRRYARNKVAPRHGLYLGEINDSPRGAWERTIAVIDERDGAPRQLALFPEDRPPPPGEVETLQGRLSALTLEHPRQWGACWLAGELGCPLHRDDFFGARRPASRAGTDWEKVLRILGIYRRLSPGSECPLHRHWFSTTARADLLGVDERAVQDDTLYRGRDLLLPHKEELFGHLRQRWSDLFGARSEVLPGNTADKTTRRGMLATIRRRYGAAERIWVMDRGLPTEEILAELRAADSGGRYLVSTPKGRLTGHEAALAARPWREVRPQLRVKLLPHEGELYVLAESQARAGKERGMRRRRLRAYWKRLGELPRQRPARDAWLKKLGAAQDRAGRIATSLVNVEVAADGPLTYRLDRATLRAVRGREGRYLLRTNLTGDDPELIWRYYMQLCFVEEAFRTLKGDLGLRPIFHQRPDRIEAHLFVAFLAYCLSIYAAPETARRGRRIDAARGSGETRDNTDARRARAHPGRPRAAVDTAHRTRRRRRAVARAPRTGTAAPAPAKDP